jgi:ribosome biogenesis GTPase A
VILVGNKLDLLPRDSENYLKHVTKCLETSALKAGLDRVRVIETILVSATNGYGVERLISSIYRWGEKRQGKTFNNDAFM